MNLFWPLLFVTAIFGAFIVMSATGNEAFAGGIIGVVLLVWGYSFLPQEFLGMFYSRYSRFRFWRRP